MGEGGPGWTLQAGEGADLLETAPALETAPSGMSSCLRVTLTSSQVRARMCFSGRTRQQKLDTRHTPTLLSASRQGSILLPGSISTHVLNLSLSLPPPPSPFLPLPPFLWPSLPRSLTHLMESLPGFTIAPVSWASSLPGSGSPCMTWPSLPFQPHLSLFCLRYRPPARRTLLS